MDETRERIGANIKKAAQMRGIKQVDIANYLGVSQGSVSNWIKGTNSIDIDLLAKLARFLGVTLDQLAGLEPMEQAILSAEEQQLLDDYRKAEPMYQQVARDLLREHPKKETLSESRVG